MPASGSAPDQLLLLQPTRAIPARTSPPAMAEGLGADYWLTGPRRTATAPSSSACSPPPYAGSHRVPAGLTMDDAYAACDAVVFPRPGRASALP